MGLTGDRACGNWEGNEVKGDVEGSSVLVPRPDLFVSLILQPTAR